MLSFRKDYLGKTGKTEGSELITAKWKAYGVQLHKFGTFVQSKCFLNISCHPQQQWFHRKKWLWPQGQLKEPSLEWSHSFYTMHSCLLNVKHYFTIICLQSSSQVKLFSFWDKNSVASIVEVGREYWIPGIHLGSSFCGLHLLLKVLNYSLRRELRSPDGRISFLVGLWGP